VVGCWNFIGVLVSSGAVAFSVVSLLPVELVINVGSAAGFAMVFALLVSAIHLEFGHLVFGAAGFEFAHADRLDPRSGAGQLDDGSRASFWRRGQLGLGVRRGIIAPDLAHHWVCGLGAAAADN